ncbi:hypothetical protein E5E39_06105 [Helicobacter pylori]|nr:hypothetical protein E5E39_06105 [Helicobacter pylori]
MRFSNETKTFILALIRHIPKLVFVFACSDKNILVMLLTMPFIIAMHEISAYCGHPSNFLVEGLVILGLVCVFGICSRLCAKWGW